LTIKLKNKAPSSGKRRIHTYISCYGMSSHIFTN